MRPHASLASRWSSITALLLAMATALSVASAIPFPPHVEAATDLVSAEMAGCPVFPADNVWNTPVDGLPLDPNSTTYVNTIGAARNAHPDFGSGTWNGGPIGIPYVVVSGSQARTRVSFEYQDESDPGPYPIPPNPPIEGGPSSTGDRHVLVVDRDNCMLYELFSAYPQTDGSWQAGSGAIFDLKSNALRPEGWTSADAAGLPILPGLVRYDEVASGEIRHAIRFTAPQTRRAFMWPARHRASSLTGTQYPPMGQRFRLRADFDISGYAQEVQVILRAMKKYGMILADNGSSWFLSGAPDERWNNDNLRQLRRLKGSDFEAVDESSLMVNPNSGQVRGASTAGPGPAPTSATPQPQPSPAGPYHFLLGFKALADLIPGIGGVPLENEHHNPANGDGLQRTTTGLMVWRKADNWTAFTDGSMTWINGPYGLQDRPNDLSFPWER